MLQTAIEFVSIIRDPIWGEIPITRSEEKLIKTRAFSRLRNIKQMSMAYLGFIGAQHTRYEHSIGTMHVAYQLLKGLSPLPNTVETENKLKDASVLIDDQAVKYVRFAALLHDVGHAPLSHLLESSIDGNPQIIEDCIRKIEKEKDSTFSQNDIETFKKYSHESFSVRRVLQDGEILQILQNEDINPTYVAYLIAGYPAKGMPLKYRVLKPIISGDLDADRLDYINRDSYFCGLKQTVDLTLFAKALSIGFNNENGPSILIDEQSVLHASSFLFSRLMLEQSIHYDEKSKYIEQVFLDLVRDYLLEMNYKDRLNYIIKLHTEYYDADFIAQLSQFSEETIRSIEKIGKRHHVKPRFYCSQRELFDGAISDNIKTVIDLSTEELHPRWKYYTNYLLRNRHLISEVKKILYDKVIKEPNFSLDIFSSKASQMILPVYKGGGVKNLCDDFTITLPHSLMVSAMQSIRVCIHATKEFEIENIKFSPALLRKIGGLSLKSDVYAFSNQQINTATTPNTIKLYCALCFYIQEVCINSLKSNEKLPEELVLLIIMNAIKKHARQALNHYAAVWIKKDTVLHEFVVKHFSNYFKSQAQPKTNMGFNSELYRITEQLVCWGFIDHVHKPIAFPNREKVSSNRFVTRTDRTINQWGEDFVKNIKNNINSNIILDIEEKVFGIQNIVKEDLKNLKLFQLSADEHDTQEIEKRIRQKGGCVIKFV